MVRPAPSSLMLVETRAPWPWALCGLRQRTGTHSTRKGDESHLPRMSSLRFQYSGTGPQSRPLAGIRTRPHPGAGRTRPRLAHGGPETARPPPHRSNPPNARVTKPCLRLTKPPNRRCDKEGRGLAGLGDVLYLPAASPAPNLRGVPSAHPHPPPLPLHACSSSLRCSKARAGVLFWGRRKAVGMLRLSV